MPEETRESRLKRLHMRSIRRGIKEMDLILSAFSAARLAQLDQAGLALYDSLLNEIDHDLYQWVSGQAECPPQYQALISDIQAHLPGATA